MHVRMHIRMHKLRDTHTQRDTQEQECTHTEGCRSIEVQVRMHRLSDAHSDACACMCCLSCSITLLRCRLCVQEVREELLSRAGHWALVKAPAALLQGRDCTGRGQTPLPRVFSSTCFVANSLFVNNGREGAESPQGG